MKQLLFLPLTLFLIGGVPAVIVIFGNIFLFHRLCALLFTWLMNGAIIVLFWKQISSIGSIYPLTWLFVGVWLMLTSQLIPAAYLYLFKKSTDDPIFVKYFYFKDFILKGIFPFAWLAIFSGIFFISGLLISLIYFWPLYFVHLALSPMIRRIYLKYMKMIALKHGFKLK